MPQTVLDRTTRPIALVLAGGNALGAYHAGAFGKLHEAGITPAWIAGSSVGAITAAIIAGTAGSERLRALREFWRLAALPTGLWDLRPAPLLQPVRLGATLQTRLFGRPAMFWPRLDRMLAASEPRSNRLSIYDPTPLRRTLEKLIDFERLNSGAIRVSVMTVDIETGEEAVFDTSSAPLRLEHLLASIGFIPDFPPVEIEGRLLGDGGLSANTPVEIVLSESGDDLLCFVLDCFPRAGRRPQSLLEAFERQSDLIFANQTQKAIDAFVRAEAAQPRRQRTIDIVRLAYRPSADEFGMKGFDFSRATLERRLQSGANDMAAALEILAPLERKAGIRVLNPAA